MKPLLLSLSLVTTLSVSAQNNFKFLDINNVKAGIANRGDMHWDVYGTGNASYEVPKGSGKHSDFASALWLGGLDAGGQLHMAAQTYRQGGSDFWPGPLDTVNATGITGISNPYDKIWKLNKTDIDAFTTNFANGNVQNGSYTPVADLLSWPAQGTGNYTKNMAPFADVNANGIYDPMVGGDYPVIKGDQSLYFIFNDNLNSHQNSGGQALKVEIHATAYAYGNSAFTSQYPFLDRTTFYNYKIINRSNINYHDVFLSMWTDADVGQYADDYVGCNVTGNYGYMYNGDADDETAFGVNGYGADPPAAGYQVLKGPYSANDGVDNNHNGAVDETCEQMLMTRFTTFNNMLPGFPASTTDPQTAAEYYNYMTGFWKDGTPFTCGGNGYGGSVPTPFLYPGSTYTTGACGSATWSDTGVPGDRRYVIGIGPFDFNKNQIHEIEFAHCTSFDYTNHNPVQKLAIEMGMIRSFMNVFDPPTACSFVSVKETENEFELSLFPNPATNQLSLAFNNKNAKPLAIDITDVCGKVVISQIANEINNVTVAISNLSPGIYFAKLSIEGKSVTKKFVKE